VRFERVPLSAEPPKADIRRLECPLWANSGHWFTYSITSSARASIIGGIDDFGSRQIDD
jgi:hypothetical protein